MAEQTPGNLGGLGAGFFLGRSTSRNKNIDASVDALEQQVNRLTETLRKLTGATSDATSRQSGGSQTGGTRVGGNWSMNGGAHSPTSHRAEGESKWTGGKGYEGQRTGTPTTFRETMASGNGGHGGSYLGGVAAGAYDAAGGRAGIARGVGVAAAGALTTYTANHGADQIVRHSMNTMHGMGRDVGTTDARMFQNNYTASSSQEMFQYQTLMATRGNQSIMSPGYMAQRTATEGLTAATNGMVGLVEGEQARQAMGTATSFNMMRGLGIQTQDSSGNTDIRSIANQILSKMGGSRVKTEAQLMAAMGPSGSVTVTLDGMVANGYIPAASSNAVRMAVMQQLRAQIAGISYQSYVSATNMAATGNEGEREAARKVLEPMGGANDLLTQQRESMGLSRDTESETLEGFGAVTEQATSALQDFRDMLNGIMSIPGVGEFVGGSSGFQGTVGRTLSSLPIVGSLFGGSGPLSAFTGGGGGDGPASAGSGAAMYAGRTNTASAGAGFGAAMASGGGSGGSYAKASGQSTGSGKSVNSYPLGAVKPWVQAAADHVGNKFGVGTIGGYRASSAVSNSDHPKGLAIDIMCSTSQGNQIAPYIVANRKKLNITYLIWRQRIWSTSQPGWRMMEDRGSPTANHMDHVHVSFLASPVNKDYSDMGGASGGGGGSMGAALGGGGGGAESTGAAGGGVTNASMGSSGYGGFSESALLGGVTAPGGVFGGASADESGGGSGGAGGAGYGGGGSGAGGSVRIGSYNVRFDTTNKQTIQDFNRLASKTDVLGLQEIRQKAGAFKSWLSENTSWGWHQGKDGDTAIAWDKDKYRSVSRGTHDLLDRLDDKNRRVIPTSSAYVMLQNKETGSRFWAVSSHLQAHVASRGGDRGRTQQVQMDQLASLYKRLKDTGVPVLSVGDFNNRDASDSAPGARAVGKGIDKILFSGGKASGVGTMAGNSDHDAIYANINLPGNKGGGGNGGTPAANMKLGQAMAANRGWSGAQWADLKNLWMKESGWRTDADNPSSSAYGIPQALTELHNLGNKYKTDPRTQIDWGLNYIKGRYGSPSKAWDFWQKNNWYDTGEWNIRDDKDARVHKGEMILPSKVADEVRNSLTGPDGLKQKSGGGAKIIFESGAIQVNLGSDSRTTKQDARRFGRSIVDEMVADERMKNLAMGV